MSKLINNDLKNLTNWLNANKISLNASKTELVFFKPKRKHIELDLKIKLNRKRLFSTESVKYLGVQIDKELNWKTHIDFIALKLNRAIAMLYKLRDFVIPKTLISVYYALFESHLNYASIVWGQNIHSINRLFILQKKAIRTLFYKQQNEHSTPLFLESKIIKLPDKVKLENCLLVNKYFHDKLPSIFKQWFTLSSDSHKYETSFASNGNLKIPSVKTTSYGKSSFINMAIKTWNTLQMEFKDKNLNSYTQNQLKMLLQLYFLDSYKLSAE